ncbi:MAG: lysine--tRNA ligase [Acidiferrobacteraceae bacterium]
MSGEDRNLHADENTQIAQRRAKLAGLRAEGVAFPNDFRRDALAGDLHVRYGKLSPEVLDQERVTVRIAGRLMAKRVMGKASFAQVQDMSGRMQLFLQQDGLPEGLYERFKRWDLGDILGAEGTLFKTKTGELSVRVDHARLLTKSLRPLPEKFHGLSDQELRYRRRYLDLIVNEQTRRVFRARSEVVLGLREFLGTRGFFEVETPMMHVMPGGAAARPFVTHHNALDMTLYLRIAPELYLKRLVVGGLERVFEINRNFRNEGLSTRHNPEFTMLEFYQAYADYQDLMDLTEVMMRELAARVVGSLTVPYQGEQYDLAARFRRFTVEEAILSFNPGIEKNLLRDVDRLRQIAQAAGIPVKPEFGAGKLQIEIFEKTVEAKLRQPTFVTGYPAEVSPLARCNDADPFVTDRFELFVGGREIANGFSELNDPEEQARRFAQQAEEKARGDEEAMPADMDYVEALEYGLPPVAGEGIGVDRLVMLLTDSASIRDVILFPHLRPE